MQNPEASPQPAAATMQDIADRLNLSVATVSRALRRVPGINAETRARVLQAASELGYRLPQSYRNTFLETGNLLHVGVFIEMAQSSLQPAYLTGMSDAAISLNASLTIHYAKPGDCAKLLDPKSQPLAMRNGLLAGLVLIFWWPLDVVRKLSEMLPVVSIMHKYPGLDMDMIGIDNEEGMEILLRHLYELGHRRIGFFGRCGQVHWANVRFGGYVAGLAALGLEYHPEWVIDAPFEDVSNYDAPWTGCTEAAERLVRDGGVTALVCVSEPGGWQLHRWLTSRGLRVPEDVSITGFHRPAFREPGQPDLTSVSASYEGIGAAALRRLLYRVQNPLETSRTILFPSEFYPGETAVSPLDSRTVG